MMRQNVPCLIATGAGTAVKGNVLVPQAGMSYRLISIVEVPRVATPPHADNYVVRTVKIGANAVCTAKTTAASGGAAMAANVASPFVGLSADLAKTLITADSPLYVDVTHNAAGAQISADYFALVELVR